MGSRGVPVSLRLQYARPGEVITSAGELLDSPAAMRRHLGELDSHHAVARTYSTWHHVEAYRRLCVERFAALVGTDIEAAEVALETVRRGRERQHQRRAA